MDSVVKVLRELALPIEELANRTRLSPARIQDILEGARVTTADLRALSRGLRVPMRAFSKGTLETSDHAGLNMAFRSLPKANIDKHEPTYERISSFVDAALKVLPIRHGKPAWLNAFPEDPTETYGNAESMAARFRQLVLDDPDLQPITELPEILQNLEGLILSTLPQSKYEGASLYFGGYVFIFVSPRFKGRMLFTLAHELGHAIAHHHNRKVVFDLPGNIGTRSSRSESFVDAFASCVLLPEQGVGRALLAIRNSIGKSDGPVGDIEIAFLARFFGVSFEAAALRCENLELLPPGGAASLVAHIKSEHKNPERRADELNLPPRIDVQIPILDRKLLRHSFSRIEDGEVSPSWLAENFGVSLETIYKLNAEHGGGIELRH